MTTSHRSLWALIGGGRHPIRRGLPGGDLRAHSGRFRQRCLAQVLLSLSQVLEHTAVQPEPTSSPQILKQPSAHSPFDRRSAHKIKGAGEAPCPTMTT